MCIDTVSQPNVSRYGDILIYCCISKACTEKSLHFTWLVDFKIHAYV